MNDAVFSEEAWNDFQYFQTHDKKKAKKINDLIDDILKNGNQGIGKPEPLKGDLSGFWSRHIDKKNRLIYKIENDQLFIVSCRYHYDDK